MTEKEKFVMGLLLAADSGKKIFKEYFRDLISNFIKRCNDVKILLKAKAIAIKEKLEWLLDAVIKRAKELYKAFFINQEQHDSLVRCGGHSKPVKFIFMGF